MTACEVCGGPLPAGSRRDRKTCSARCHIAAWRKRDPAAPRGPGVRVDLAGLWCSACDRPAPFGRIVDGRLLLLGSSVGGWDWDGSAWRWSIYARGHRRTALPTTVVCPRCRTLQAVTEGATSAA